HGNIGTGIGEGFGDRTPYSARASHHQRRAPGHAEAPNQIDILRFRGSHRLLHGSGNPELIQRFGRKLETKARLVRQPDVSIDNINWLGHHRLPPWLVLLPDNVGTSSSQMRGMLHEKM